MMRIRPAWITHLLVLGCVLTLSGCFKATHEADCLLDGTCECKAKSDCPSGRDCVDGRCFLIPDAGIGEPGWPCTSDTECLRGPCLPRGPGNGQICSALCATDAGFACPGGWECKVAQDGGDVCVPPLKALCLPCQADSDCNAAGDHCLTFADGSRGCGQDCSFTACPTGYSCLDQHLDGGDVKQCVPDAKTCTCSVVTAGLKRACKRANTVGTCFGFETCRSTGAWTGCDAPDASVEVCDGVDNDCNGLVDQADPGMSSAGLPGYPNCTKGLTCSGKWTCGPTSLDGGVSFFCSAPDPLQETCNGLDDDCNGVVDDGLTDAQGHYVSVRACGSCDTDCFSVLQHLATDGGLDAGPLPGAATCEPRAGALACVPKACAKGYLPTPQGAAQVCAKVVSPQCRPCTDSTDCQVPSDVCVSLPNDPGTSCVQSCDPSSAYAGCTGKTGTQDCCPADSLCTATAGKKLCLPLGGSCTCTPDRVGFTRSCFKTNGTATCVGSQTCGADGAFAACDTSQTTVELCDGADNDCNGVIDDPFVNTQGTHTWDTDQHCGNCSTDCTARWSPTIQHAIGGCAVDGGAPGCAIVQCTQATVPAEGPVLCRADADCGTGATCSPVFHQCVRTCTAATGTGCLSGESCVDGACAKTCSTSSDCASLGAGAVCNVHHQCGVAYQFINADKDDTNGCECASVSGVADEPDVFDAYPLAGATYVDRDCDGVDGTVATSLFVWAQSSSSLGTRAAPFKTLSEAVAAFDPTRHTAILVAQGTYVEQLVLKSGVKVYGGYSSTFAHRDIVTYPTLIEAAEPTSLVAKRGTVNAENLSAATVLSGFTVRGYDVTSRTAPGSPARNSYAVYVKNSPGFSLTDSHLVGGRGGDALSGAAGGAGANGGAGQSGQTSRECATPDCLSETQTGGVAGSNPACSGSTSGNPGAGSDLNLDPQQYPGGFNGKGGANGIYAHSDPSQAAFCKYDCTVPADGLNGGPASNGSDGTATSAGQGCTTATGGLGTDDWSAGAGTAGGDGLAGLGGGGGGAGGCVRNTNPSSCTVGHLVGDLGATGGGGGAGGCGGGRGSPAGSGGGSFAVLIIGAAPTLSGNLIDLGFGGRGGDGGAGGYGGLGGQGGRGGESTTLAWCAGLGGPGGRGGNGGAGSGGGAGCGGSVFGIVGRNIGGLGYAGRNTIVSTASTAVGAGGTGGSSPSGASFKGGDGVSGVIVPVQSF
jgi:hypothetical protein